MEIPYKNFTGNYNNLEIFFLEPIVIYQNGILTIEEKPFSIVSSYPEFIKLKYKNGKKVQEIKKHVSSNSLFQTNFILNQFAQLQEINIPDQDDFYNQFLFTYDEFGKKVKEEKIEYGKSKWRNYYHYDSNGFLIKEEWRSYEFPLIDYFYENDSNGNITRKRGIYLIGQVETFEDTKFEYNSLNLCIKRKSYDKVETFDYDTNRRLIYCEVNYDKSNSCIKKKMSYDNLGNILNYIELHNETVYQKIEWKYSFDNSQNWIKAIQIDDNKPKLVIIRKFS